MTKEQPAHDDFCRPKLALDHPLSKHILYKLKKALSGIAKVKNMNKEQQQDILVPDSADINLLTLKINAETLEYGTAYPFGFFIRDESDQIIAGCNGSVIYGAIYADQLWVSPSHRKLGLGRKLMAQVHRQGRKANCKMATTMTMDFQQARSFYEKLGYICDFEREGYVQNSTCYFLRKSL